MPKGCRNDGQWVSVLVFTEHGVIASSTSTGQLVEFSPPGVLRWFLMVLTFGGGKVQRRLYESIGVKAAAFFLHVFV